MAERVHIPRTPPPGIDGDGLHYLINHHVGTPYSSGAEGGPTDFSSSHGTPYGSPGPSWGMDQGGHSAYDWYSPMNQYSGHHYPSPYLEQRADGPTTRNRNAARSRGSPASRQATSSPASNRSRKAKNTKAAKSSNVNLDAPLSVLTKDSKVPLKDMESFVHRDIEERTKEKDKKNGYIVRPMNAFMLYRSAYADRAKNLFAQNNHQIVSKATGQSWRMESKEVQEHYKMLAEIERDNHAKAWPDYKFTPSKAGAAARKRKESEFGSDEEGTDQDPSDYDWTPSGARKPRPARATNRRQLREKEVGSPYPQHRHPPYMPPPPPLHPSHYGTSNPGHPMPIPMQDLNSLDHGSGYYQQSARYLPGHPGTEDVHFEQPDYRSSEMLGAASFPPSGLARDNQGNFFADYPPYHGSGYYSYLDPKLEDFGAMSSQGMFTEDGFNAYHGDLLAQQVHHDDGEPLQAADQGLTNVFADDDNFRGWIDGENQQ